jgi:O-methyltransferase involved in polyketide biosynthesis
MSDIKNKLSGVQETLFLPLWGRAHETRKSKPLLVDNTAVSIVESIDYNFADIAEKINPVSRAAWIARSLFFDKEIKLFLEKYPDGSVVNIGCGLDTTFDRVNNGTAIWYELDLPDVIELRKRYINESLLRKFLPYSVFDEKWYQEIKNKKKVFLLLAGVIYYFEENEIKALFNSFCTIFERCEIVFDYSSPRGAKIANKRVIQDGGMDKSAYLKWGIDNLKEIEKWNNKIKIIKNIPLFKEFKKNYPVIKRIGMNISDAMNIMSLAHISTGSFDRQSA